MYTTIGHITMIINAHSLDENTSIDTEICIIGGGVTGITLAKELHNKFNNIVLIEAGSETYSKQSQNLYAAEEKTNLFPNPENSRLRFLGGSSNHWENSTNQFDPIDFDKRDWVPDSGWPISYEDTSMYYPKAEEYCGVSNNGYNLKFWLNKLKAADPFSRSSEIESFITQSAVPPTRFYDKYKHELANSSTLTIYKNANFTDIEFEAETESVQSIVFYTKPGIKHTITANAYIMCLGGIENARMLLEINEKNNSRIGNQYGNVGRYFMEHPTIRAAQLYPTNKSLFKLYNSVFLQNKIVKGSIKLTESALKRHQINNVRIPLAESTRLYMSHGISSSHVLSDAIKNLQLPEYFGTHLINIIKDIDLITEKTFDTDLFDDSHDFGGYIIPAMIEQTPDRNNRITLGKTRDIFNIRRIIISWNLSEENKRSAWKAFDLLAREVGKLAIGRLRVLKERESRLWESQLGFGHHHMGTTRMANSVKQGVVDSNQKVFGTNNLYVGGSSVFTTGSHVPPTLTIVALTIRLANHLSRRYRS